MTSAGGHQTAAALATPFAALGLPLKGQPGLEADHRVVDLCAAFGSTEPFAT
jgi:hypothetical protein